MEAPFLFAQDATEFSEGPTAPGVYFGLDNSLYHAGAGLSSTGVRRILKTPFHFYAATLPNNKPKAPPTASILNGHLTHCLLLEPGEFESRYRVGPTVNKNTLIWREYVAEWAAKGVQVIGEEQFDAAFAQARNLRAVEAVAELLADGVCETSGYWIDPATGVLCKCRPDCISPIAHRTQLMPLDVKTTTDASPEAFGRSALSWGYHYQAAWYCDGYAIASGMEVQDMLFAVVENEYPYAAAVYMLDDKAIAYARRRNAFALQRYAECVCSQVWPGYPSEVQPLYLPEWGMRD